MICYDDYESEQNNKYYNEQCGGAIYAFNIIGKNINIRF